MHHVWAEEFKVLVFWFTLMEGTLLLVLFPNSLGVSDTNHSLDNEASVSFFSDHPVLQDKAPFTQRPLKFCIV